MKVLVTLWLVVFFIAARMWLEDHRWLRARKRSREPGLNTVADADHFVQEIRDGFGEFNRGRIPLAPLEHNDTSVYVPRLRTTPLVGLKAPVAMVRSEPVFAGMGTPIYDQLVRDIKARRRALRMRTQEVRVIFDELITKWMCTFCEYEGCRGCPGCSCSCKLAVVA